MRASYVLRFCLVVAIATSGLTSRVQGGAKKESGSCKIVSNQTFVCDLTSVGEPCKDELHLLVS